MVELWPFCTGTQHQCMSADNFCNCYRTVPQYCLAKFTKRSKIEDAEPTETQKLFHTQENQGEKKRRKRVIYNYPYHNH